MEETYFCYSLALLIIFPVILKLSITKITQNHNKNLPPSPPSLPIIGHLHLLKQPVHRTLQSLSSKFGKTILLRWGSRKVLLVSSPLIAEECLTKHDIIFANRPRLLAGKHFNYDFTTVSVAPYGDLWRNLRRIMTLEMFSSSRLVMFSSVRQGEVRLLLNQIMKSGSVPIDLKSKFTELSFNAMTMMILGKRYYGENVLDVEEAKNMQKVMRDGVDLSGATNLGDFLPFLQWMDITGIEKKMVSIMAKLDSFLQGLVEERRAFLSSDFASNGEEVGKLTIDNLLKLQETDSQVYTDEIIKGIIMVLLVAGTDTSSSSLDWAMALLLNHPEEMEKVRAEIDTNVGQERPLEEQDLPKLKYLQNVIHETHRLYPPVPLLVPHEASEDCVVGGYDVPRHTMLVINAWAIHRDPEIWEDPTKFKPERFEGWSGEGSQGYKLIPFGNGRRGCPGAGLGNRLVGLALGSLIQSFEWERVGEEKVDMSEGLGLVMQRVEPLEAICKPRPIMLSSM
ncbi:isoflavone 2'-hydroxylase-like [Pyrus ussuriensis x Pyrus communis]|uniref:Isoflavone 2'-hydroxylase-like n=1 Tax=Pyrus ussuriensis x Pyrus communis TaxID=2448454 RepID=A0A5N5GWD3_9ROSA|nr:isoflavone 2'-hydroxylase-like [Pyrus ussuriensis x Pyrus communis]